MASSGTKRSRVRGEAARLAGLLAVLALGLALTGCLNIRSTLEVERDNTVSGELLVVADKAELDKQEGSLAEAFASWRGQLPALPPGGESVYDQNGQYGVRITFKDSSFEEFNQGKAMRLRREGNRVVFSLPLDPAGYVRPDRSLEDTRTLLSTMRFDITVTMPGTVQRYNGTLSGRTVTWKLGKGSEASELRAESVVPAPSPSPKPTSAASRSESGPPWQLIGGGLLVAAGLGVGVLAWRRGRTASQP